MDEPREPDPKRAKLRLQLKNGHDCIFTKDLPEHLQVECSVCLCVLRDPHMIDCKCGASFCQPCIQPTLEERKPCPLCNKPFSLSISNPSLQRTINDLKVYCSFKEAGCEWVGELGAMDEHLNDDIESDSYVSSGCAFMPLKCCYCEQEFQRQYVFKHEMNECLKRPFQCECCHEYESTFEDVIAKHMNVCPCRLVPCPNECGISLQRKSMDDHLTANCPLEIISCSFSYAGCETKLPRKGMPAHISDSLAVHMSLQVNSHQKQLEKLQAQVFSLQKEVKALRSKQAEDFEFVCDHLRIMPVNLVVNDFATKKREGSSWWSEPFYSHLHGYKMALSVDCNGYDEAEGTHVSVFVSLMKGDFDNRLEWPYRGAISIQLLDQEDIVEHYSRNLTFDDAQEEYTRRVTKGDSNRWWGFPYFISQTELLKYLKNDSLCFKLSRYMDQ